ncbi:MAG: SDR family NAD(P)-dependent oxidoreductase [Candidatus Binatia bacterium]
MERKVAFVTGASRGIGKASALALAEVGYDVVVTARTVEEGERYDYGPSLAQSGERAMPGSLRVTAEEIRRRGRAALPIRLDLLDRGSIDAAVDRALREWGHVDLLLNNGIYQGPGLMDRLLDLSDEMVRTVFEGNVFAQIHLTQRVVRAMLDRGRGVVVNVTSNAGLADPPGPAGEGGWGFAYGASKGAFHRMAGILHVELRDRGIRAYNVEPGLILTEAQKVLFGDDSDLVRHYRGAPPAVPAAVVAWLATDPEAVAMSGQTIAAQPFCKQRGLVAGWPPAR